MGYSNLSQEEWRAIGSVVNDRSIIIETDQGSCAG